MILPIEGLFLCVDDVNKEGRRGSIHPSKLYYLLMHSTEAAGSARHMYQTQTIPDCKFDTETFGGSVFNTDIETET